MSWASFNLRSLLVGTIGFLSLLVVSVSGMMALDAWKDGRVATRVVKVNKIADSLLESSGEIITERDLAAEFLITGSSSTAGVFTAISGRMDASWLKAKMLLSAERPGQGIGTSQADAGQLVEEADAAYDAFARVRARMMTELKKPIGDRDYGVLKDWNEMAAKAISAQASLRRDVAHQANLVDPVTQTLSLLKDLTLSITDFAGRESVMVAGAIFKEEPLSPRQARVLLDHRGRMDQAWQTISNTADAAAADSVLKDAVESVRQQFIGKFGKSRKANFDASVSASRYPVSAKQWLSLKREALTSLTGLRDALIAANQIHAAGQSGRASMVLVVSSLLLLLAVVTTAASFMIVSRRVINPVVAMTATTGRLAAGDMEVAIPGGDRSDEIGDMARSLDEIRNVGVRAARTHAALNDSSAAVIMVDPAGEVIFANKAMKRLHGELAAPFAMLPGFAAHRIIGQRFDDLHDIGQMTSQNLANIDEQTTAQLVKGGHTLDLIASPALNDQDERLGTVVEWRERTQELAIEEEVSDLVTAAALGDFSRRLEEHGKAGFMLELTRGMNALVETVDRGLGETVEVMSGLAGGDLTKRMTGDYKGNFQQLKDDVNRTSDQLRQIAGQIVAASASVDGATGEIATGVTGLSTRTEHQASALEETTASMEELSATVKQNADNAQEANQIAAAARESATNGGEVAGDAISAMSRIEDSSKQITEIVGLIQEIAFQTNLLALNAAVEAARAGDAGKGFAVVANEVRALAQRAGQASKDIKELISNSDDQVKEGVELVNKAGASLEEIVGSVKKVADFVSEIAAASQEQSSGIDQVSRAINSMEEMTQQNGALVEETTGALQSAQTQVSDLREVVGFFKTGEEAAAMPIAEVVEEDVNDNAVHEQQTAVRRAVAGGAAQEADADWQEF
ncbi:MAG: HAMP domain-containing protein [Rhizobiales bacterium]|nr:HAMP domain-containing protein [Hyphomicrobiales bacterium]